MAQLMSDWLHEDVRYHLNEALRWRHPLSSNADLLSIKSEFSTGDPDAPNSVRFEDDGSNIRIKVHRSIGKRSVVQIAQVGMILTRLGSAEET